METPLQVPCNLQDRDGFSAATHQKLAAVSLNEHKYHRDISGYSKAIQCVKASNYELFQKYKDACSY